MLELVRVGRRSYRRIRNVFPGFPAASDYVERSREHPFCHDGRPCRREMAIVDVELRRFFLDSIGDRSDIGEGNAIAFKQFPNTW